MTRSLFSAFRLMDEEASAKWGLEDYGRFRRPELKRPQNEVEWSRRLAELLRHDGILARPEERYPSAPRLRCDLRLTLRDGTRIWLELKGAWKTYWALKRSLWLYRAHLGLDAGKTHSAALDVVKLAGLTSADADRVGFILVGFDDPLHPMTRDVEGFARGAGLESWAQSGVAWPCLRRLGHHVRLWCWTRQLS